MINSFWLSWKWMHHWPNWREWSKLWRPWMKNCNLKYWTLSMFCVPKSIRGYKTIIFRYFYHFLFHYYIYFFLIWVLSILLKTDKLILPSFHIFDNFWMLNYFYLFKRNTFCFVMLTYFVICIAIFRNSNNASLAVFYALNQDQLLSTKLKAANSLYFCLIHSISKLWTE